MDSSWPQVTITFDAWDTAERTAAAHLGPALADAEAAGLMSAWFFIRKAPCWRLRFLPTQGNADRATALIHDQLVNLQSASQIAGWAATVYEPEVHAFGGPAAIASAHRLFHADSRHILTWLHGQAAGAGSGDRRRELSLLLCRVLLRAAQQDWYEQGDVWARVARHRAPPEIPPERRTALQADLRRLLTADTTHLFGAAGPLAEHAAWADAYQQAGAWLGEAARTSTLRRGVRAVLSHHVIFAWNRLGLPHATQGVLANVAASVVFDQ